MLIPYDLDAVLGTQGGTQSPLWRAAANPALAQLMSRPAVAVRYWFHLEDLAQTVFSAEQLEPVIDRLVGDYLPRTEVDRLKSFAAKRGEFVLSQIPRELTVATGLAKRDGAPLRSGTFVRASIEGRTQENVIVLPRHALRGKNQVWIVCEKSTLQEWLGYREPSHHKRLIFRSVDVSFADAKQVIVAAGIQQGEQVVVSLLAAVVDGMGVKVREAESTDE